LHALNVVGTEQKSKSVADGIEYRRHELITMSDSTNFVGDSSRFDNTDTLPAGDSLVFLEVITDSVPKEVVTETHESVIVKGLRDFSDSLKTFVGSADLPLIVVLSVVGLLTLAKVIYSKYLGQIFRTLVSYSESYKAYRDNNFVARQFYFFAHVIYFLILALFVSTQLEINGLSIGSYDNFVNFGLIFVALVVLSFFKRVVLKTLGQLFMAYRIAEEYWFQSLSINIVASFVAFPVLCAQVIFTGEYDIYFTTSLWVIVGLAYLMRVVRALRLTSAKQLSVLYMILYLISLEVLPVLLALKYFRALF
ncbi:MAG: hypothetical protein RIS47_1037, partial [Bacteroidota bacterium]